MSKVYTTKDRSYFEVTSEELAPRLIGKVLCYRDGDFVIRGRILITEAYRECDCSADGNRGKGGSAQLKAGGHFHYHGGRARIDIVAGPEGIVESVLIRGIDPYGSHPTNSVEAMGITPKIGAELDGLDLLEEGEKPEKERIIWIEDDGVKAEIAVPQPRTNIDNTDPLQFRAKTFTFE